MRQLCYIIERYIFKTQNTKYMYIRIFLESYEKYELYIYIK